MLSVLVGPRLRSCGLSGWAVRVLRRWFLGRLGVVGVRGSCSLSFSHLIPVSPNDDLPDWGLLLGLGAFAPLLEPVARLFYGGVAGPFESAERFCCRSASVMLILQDSDF